MDNDSTTTTEKPSIPDDWRSSMGVSVTDVNKYVPREVLEDIDAPTAGNVRTITYLMLESIRLQRSSRNYLAAIFWVPIVASVLWVVLYAMSH